MVKIAVSVIIAALMSAPVLGLPVPSEGLQARNHCVINNNGVKQSIQVAPGQDCSVFNNNGAGGSQSASCSGDDCNIVENGDGSVSVSASSVGRKRRDLSGRAIVQGLKARSETCTITINGVTKTINLQPGQPCVANANSGFGGDDSGDDANDGAGADDSGDNVNDNDNSIFNGADGDNASCSGDNCSIIDNGDGSVSVSASSFGKRDFSDFFGDGDSASCSGDDCSIIDNGDGSVSVSASSFGKRDFSDFFGDGDSASCSGDDCNIVDNGDGSVSVSSCSGDGCGDF